jgi:hypothetical protein
MAVRTSFTAGEVLAAADLTDTFGAKLNVAGGKVLQVVRATDTTNRSTTSTSFVDASISVTITPQKTDSTILVVYNAFIGWARPTGDGGFCIAQLTDTSNNALSGAELLQQGFYLTSAIAQWSSSHGFNLIGRVAPATLSPVTYKARFRAQFGSTTVTIENATQTGQMYAIEVSA